VACESIAQVNVALGLDSVEHPFKVFTVMKMSILVFWVVIPCGLVGSYKHSSEISRI
jgi:hypothetical protein